MWKASLIVLCLLAGAASAQVYKWVDADGVVHYSDEPNPRARRFEPPEISVYPFRVPKSKPAIQPRREFQPEPEPEPEPEPGTEPGTETETETETERDAALPYEDLRILRPANNARISAAAGAVEVEIALAPGLQREQVIHLLLDGRKVRTDLLSSRATLDHIAPGSHVLEARIVDAAGNELKRTRSILFHVD